MSKRYGTLDVSLSLPKTGSHKLNKTIEAYTEREDEESSKTENDEKYPSFNAESTGSRSSTTKMKN